MPLHLPFRQTGRTAAAPHTVAFDTGGSHLSADRRRIDLAALTAASDRGTPEHVDLVVIGAGVTGTGVALDATTRGLDVLLVDAHDLAFGTSRWSSKLAHGGLRYLATGDVGIARRSAKERGILMETSAPHLVHAVPQVVPVQDRYSLANRILPRLGFFAGDLLRVAAGTSSTTLPWSCTVSPKTVRRLCPAVETDDLRFGYVNYDGQLIDDARLVTDLARTAAGYGARVLTHTRAVEAHGDRVVLQDGLGTGSPFTVTAGAVVNATGVWAGDLDPQVTVRPSRGTHLVVDAAVVGDPDGALTVPVPGHTNRFCFILPEQLGRCYIGITDEEPDSDDIPDVPEVPDADVDWILGVVNQALHTDLTTGDVIGAYAGLRPLVEFAGDAGAGGSTADLSREHVILTGTGQDARLVTVTGGKLTEYRLMAEQTVDVVAGLLREDGEAPGPCVTDRLPLVGAPDSGPCRDMQATELIGLPTSLIDRFGWEAPQVVADCIVDRPLDPVGFVGDGVGRRAVDTVRAEFSWHVTREGAVTVDDLLDRRSRIGLVETDRAACEETAREVLRAAGLPA
ncbi:MAG TPA: glycerol-3-phosphate dehydrogenase/oxidase [Corynebacterium nuruki]|uniref:Glycerol-3-phosphate dehydrogenase/oxidase n=1 Tax=Corynebacterium nuruki TaxID=1032851 RepID=A0A3D4T2S2_9CORY|nr:glycerol-3-phosphate dehydrogenase/oxidase [Corynebacterium nuruki]